MPSTCPGRQRRGRRRRRGCVSEGFKRDDGSLFFSRAHWAHSPQAGLLRVLEPLALGVPGVPAPVLGQIPRFIDIDSESLGRQLQSLKVVIGASERERKSSIVYHPGGTRNLFVVVPRICLRPPRGPVKGSCSSRPSLTPAEEGVPSLCRRLANKENGASVVVRKTDRQRERERKGEEIPLRFCPAQHPKGTVPELGLVLFCCCCCYFTRSDSPQWQANCL